MLVTVRYFSCYVYLLTHQSISSLLHLTVNPRKQGPCSFWLSLAPVSLAQDLAHSWILIFFFSAKLNSHWCRWPLFIIAGLCFAGSCCISGFLGSPIRSPPLPRLGLSLVTGSKVLSVALVPTIVSVPACSRLPPSPVIFYHHTVDSWRAGTLLDTSS